MIPLDSRHTLEDPYYLNIGRRLTWLSLSLAAVIVLTLSIFASLEMVVGFIAGSVISYYNFVWMKQGIDHLLEGFQPTGDSRARERRWQKGERRVIFKYFVRFALIGGSLYAIVRFRILDLRAFVLGLLLLVMAVLIECVYQVFKTLTEDRDRGRA
jgi:hypothetical protein